MLITVNGKRPGMMLNIKAPNGPHSRDLVQLRMPVVLLRNPGPEPYSVLERFSPERWEAIGAGEWTQLYLCFKDHFGCSRGMDVKETRMDLGDRLAIAAVRASTVVCLVSSRFLWPTESQVPIPA